MGSYWKDVLDISAGCRRFLASEALYGIGIGLYTMVLNYHLLAMGLNESAIGGIVSVGILVMGALAIPISMLADRVGRKPLLVGGVMAVGGGVLLFSAGDNLFAFYTAQVIVSTGLACIETTEVQLLFSYCHSRREETKIFSLMFAVFTMFVGAGTLLAGLIPNWIPWTTSEISLYKPVLWCAAFVLLALGMIRGLWLPKEGENPRIDNASGTLAEDALRSGTKAKARKPANWPKPNRAVWTLSFYMLLSGMSFALIGSFLNVIAKYRLGWGDGAITLLLTANGLVLFFASLLTPWVLERFGISSAFRWMYLGNALLAFVLSMQMPTALFAVILLVRGGGFTMLSNMIDSQSMSALQERDRNVYAGMRSVFRSVGSAGAAYAAGYLLAAGYVTLPFALTGMMLLVGYGYYYRFVQPLLDKKEIGGHTK